MGEQDGNFGVPNNLGGIVNNLEFDGNTVLCRVCGDRASGFHYGVHACEGCKGFFRRSIQQKIQYRPCVKNQHCLITRVNRNRCQYCRLKKCIAIGMSRDAVRFGRVPKREKAKILEQMQKVNVQCCNVGAVETVMNDDVEMKRRIVEAYVHTCQFTSKKASLFKESARQKAIFVNCPSRMACPLNPTPDLEYSSVDRWSLYSNGFMPAIHNIVTFAKLVPGFTYLNQDDQIILLKAGTFEVLLLHLSCLFDSKANAMFFTNEKIFLRNPHSPGSGAGYLLDSVFDFADRLMELNLKDSEAALFSSFILLSPDRPGLHNSCMIERLQSIISQLLKVEISLNHPNNPDLYEKLLLKIPEMRLLNTVHSEKLLGLSVPLTVAQCSAFPCPPVPKMSSLEHSCLLWSHQHRGLLLPESVQYTSAPGWQNNNHSSVISRSNDENVKERKKRKLEEETFVEKKYTVESSGERIANTETFLKELVINGHQVSSYLPREVVLSTPLGTFHRMPLAVWSSDHKPQINKDAPTVDSKLYDFTNDLKGFNKDGEINVNQQSNSSSPSNDPSNLVHPKKKVVRIWTTDDSSNSIDRCSSTGKGLENHDQEPPITFEEDKYLQETVSFSKKHECDSTENGVAKVDISDHFTIHSSTQGINESEINVTTEVFTPVSSFSTSYDCTRVGPKNRSFSDFNIKSRFLSSKSTQQPPSSQLSFHNSSNLPHLIACSPMAMQPHWPISKYVKSQTPFSLSPWPNSSIASAPLLLPQSVSASDYPPKLALNSFKAPPRMLLDHLIRDDKEISDVLKHSSENVTQFLSLKSSNSHSSLS